MKTEGLTQLEAWQTLLDGKCVKESGSRRALTYKAVEGSLHWWNSPKWQKSTISDSFSDNDKIFEVVPDPSIPEPKSLSFEAAVDYLNSGNGGIEILTPDRKICVLGRPDNHELLYIDLAERKGWSIKGTSF